MRFTFLHFIGQAYFLQLLFWIIFTYWQIFVRKHVGEAEPHRAWLYSKVKTAWILQLDADEFLSPNLLKKIPQLTKNTANACYEFIWPFWNGRKYITKNWPWRKALFQK